MRTVDDLRAALVSLEDEAPAVDQLLSRSASATQRTERRPARWTLPAVATGLALAVVLAVAAVAALRSAAGRTTDASHTTSHPAAVGHSRLLPFRLRSPLRQLTLVDTHSSPRRGAAFGTAVVTEYGMEVTIDVSTARGRSTTSASATRTSVGGAEGWIDTTCGLRPAQRSPGGSGRSAGHPAASTFNPTCSLSYDSGPWQVAIYVAGPGGGTRKVTSEQFRQIGDRLELAASATDPSTWFSSDDLLPS